MTVQRTTYSLENARPDHWFQNVAQSAPNFDQLCDAVGERYVAFSLVAGVRITALAIDPRSAEQTQVSFAVGDQEEDHKMTLPEFRRCLTQALTQEDVSPAETPDDPDDPEALQAFVGVRYMLLAELFGIVPLELHAGGGEPASLLIALGGVTDDVSVEEFREIVREAVRREERAMEPERPFSIDLGRIPEAAKALSDGNIERVIEILDPWAGPLSMLLRTPQGQNLGADAKAALGRALGILGSAYIERGEYPTAEEVLRLGVQWVQDGAAAGELFTELGRLSLRQSQPGQAIGLLRRAVSLGAAGESVLPLLAECFLERDRAVAALVCLEEARQAGATGAVLGSLRERAVRKVGTPYAALQAFLQSA